MKYKNAEFRAREAHADACARNLAYWAGWTFVSRPELMTPVLRDGLYDPQAHLVLMGSAGALPWGLGEAVAETRCTALVVEPGIAMTGFVTCYITLLRCAGGAVHWRRALRLWADDNDRLFLVPDPDGEDPNGDCFAVLRRQIHPCDMPWRNPYEHVRGFTRGDALILLP